ncbi:MAG: ABC transporter substrate-binding protein [Acidimicrobiales bacterium]
MSACGDSSDDADSGASGDDAGTETDAGGEEATGGDDSSDESDSSGTDEDLDPSGSAISETPLVIARDMDLSTLDPSRSFCDTCQLYLTAVYETLIGLDPSDNETFVPRLATGWEGNADNTQFTFTLDPNAVFADGSPVEAEDVAWSWLRLRNIDASASFLLASVDTIDTPDPQTVVVNLKFPDSAFLAKANAPYTVIINSETAIANGANADEDSEVTDTADPWFLENSAGSGPFVLDSFAEGDELKLTRNESFWREGPSFEEVTVRQVQDAVTQRQLLEAGDVDIAMQIDPDTAGGIDSADVLVDYVDSFNFVYIALAEGATTDVPLTPEIRQAIALAIDYEGMIDVTVGGRGKAQASPIPNGFSGTDGLTLPKQDLDGARALLEGAGVGDGFAIRAAYPTFNVYGVDFNTMMQKVPIDLAEVGIEVELVPLEVSVWVDEWFSEDGIPLTAVYYAPDHTDSIQYIEYFGQVPDARWSAQANPGGDPIIDDEQVRLQGEALAATGAEKEALYQDLAELMIDQKIVLPMVNPQLVLARRADIEGVHYSACCNLELARVARSS